MYHKGRLLPILMITDRELTLDHHGRNPVPEYLSRDLPTSSQVFFDDA